MRSNLSPGSNAALGLLAAIAIASSVVTARHAWAQQGMPPGGMPGKKLDAESVVRGQSPGQAITFSAWRKLCFERTDAKPVCRTSINSSLDTGQEMIRVDLIESEAGGRLQILLPPGEFLQAGLTLRVDDGDPIKIPYVWCLTNTCVAADAVAPQFVHAMLSGQNLKLELVNVNLLAVTALVPLDQFAGVNQGSPSQRFDQGLQGR